MQYSALTGTRIRDQRLQRGRKQAELAQLAGISASYLNLIEHNRRRIGGKLLVEIAAALEVEPALLTDGADHASTEALHAIASEAPGSDIEADRIEELISRFPGWAAHLRAQHQQIQALESTLQGLDDRLTHDPVLSEKMHDVLGAVAAIRSTASILVETPDIAADWRARFHGNIDRESRKLAATSAAMAAHFDRLTRDEAAFQTPLEVVSGFFEQRGFHVTELEQGNPGAVAKLVQRDPAFTSQPARQLGEQVLTLYAADAAKMPLAGFARAATECGFDPLQLATEFDAGIDAVLRRLATLPRQVDLPEIGLVSCDAAGAILLRKPPAGFSVPRFGSACPLWPLFAALRSPGIALRNSVESSEGAHFTTYAIAQSETAQSFDAPPVLRATMLLIAADPAPAGALALGSSCRVCPRKGCPGRREPSILS